MPGGTNPSRFSQTQRNWFKKRSCALFAALPLWSIPQSVTIHSFQDTLSHHTMPACVNAGGLGDRVRSYSGKLRREFCPTPCRCSQGEPRTPGQSVGTSALKCTLGHTWAVTGTAPQHNQHQTCTQSSSAGLSLASTHRENARDTLQLTGMRRVIKNYL